MVEYFSTNSDSSTSRASSSSFLFLSYWNNLETRGYSFRCVNQKCQSLRTWRVEKGSDQPTGSDKRIHLPMSPCMLQAWYTCLSLSSCHLKTNNLPYTTSSHLYCLTGLSHSRMKFKIKWPKRLGPLLIAKHFYAPPPSPASLEESPFTHANGKK